METLFQKEKKNLRGNLSDPYSVPPKERSRVLPGPIVINMLQLGAEPQVIVQAGL